MSEITSITVQAKDKSRCNVFVDGRFYLGLSVETVIKNRLKAGMVIDETALKAMQLESEKETALQKALAHISATQKTEKEISDFLTKKGYIPEVVSYVVEKMKEYSFIDDESYARAYAEIAKKRKGARLIKAELKRKGIADTEIAKIEDTFSSETETAQALFEKFMRGKTADKVTLQKAYRHLLSKGFDFDTAKDVLSHYGFDGEEDV